ncbi:hypothetical protein [Streptomyces sp. NPDC005374]|uniref:hypothetical protein n=1 Tax=Streptomyces sp. NPDC005374 TaxID=3364713 RepID=UPI003690D70D
MELADRHWPEEEALKRYTKELAQQRGLGREWCSQVGRAGLITRYASDLRGLGLV